MTELIANALGMPWDELVSSRGHVILHSPNSLSKNCGNSYYGDADQELLHKNELLKEKIMHLEEVLRLEQEKNALLRQLLEANQQANR
jgi:hypothetical protein